MEVSIFRPLGYEPNALPLRQPARKKKILFNFLYFI